MRFSVSDRGVEERKKISGYAEEREKELGEEWGNL